jgi:myo-inositol-1(or 4)-monophosphatase
MPPMEASGTPLDADWLGSCRAAVVDLRAVLAAVPEIGERVRETGEVGEGGDRTLVIDQRAEDRVFARLDALHADGHRFTAISEERGEVDYGGGEIRVVIDPIDGSLNAKRLMPAHALSIAVADGPTMADVAFGYVYDFGTREEWHATRGGGAFLDGVRLDPAAPERRGRSGRLELLGIEQADPRWVARSIERLEEQTERLRALGSIAITMCQVAAARMDGMVSLVGCRAVDAAAAQLIVREAGGHVAFPACAGIGAEDESGLAHAPLDVEPRSPVVCARSRETLRALATVPA